MNLEKPAKGYPRAKRFGVEFEEERAWVSFYARVRQDATVANEVLSQLDADPELKRVRLALYLSCKESVRNHKARQLRDKRIGQAVRLLLNALLVQPVLALRRALSLACDLTVECLPETGAVTPTRPSHRRDYSPVRAASDLVGVTRNPALGGSASDHGTPVSSAPRARAAGSA